MGGTAHRLYRIEAFLAAALDFAQDIAVLEKLAALYLDVGLPRLAARLCDAP